MSRDASKGDVRGPIGCRERLSEIPAVLGV